MAVIGWLQISLLILAVLDRRQAAGALHGSRLCDPCRVRCRPNGRLHPGIAGQEDRSARDEVGDVCRAHPAGRDPRLHGHLRDAAVAVAGKARDLAAWLGLVPRQYSTGGKQTLLGISKRGNLYVRKLLVHGARSCFRHLDRTRGRLGSWLDGLEGRMHPNKALVALAAKMARIVWVVLNKPGALYERRDPACA